MCAKRRRRRASVAAAQALAAEAAAGSDVDVDGRDTLTQAGGTKRHKDKVQGKAHGAKNGKRRARAAQDSSDSYHAGSATASSSSAATGLSDADTEGHDGSEGSASELAGSIASSGDGDGSGASSSGMHQRKAAPRRALGRRRHHGAGSRAGLRRAPKPPGLASIVNFDAVKNGSTHDGFPAYTLGSMGNSFKAKRSKALCLDRCTDSWAFEIDGGEDGDALARLRCTSAVAWSPSWLVGDRCHALLATATEAGVVLVWRAARASQPVHARHLHLAAHVRIAAGQAGLLTWARVGSHGENGSNHGLVLLVRTRYVDVLLLADVCNAAPHHELWFLQA